MQPIYLDFSATAPLLPPVFEAMLPYFTDQFANPSSSHRPGRLAHKALEDAREAIAGLLDAHADEVIFTSGATEANNLAVSGQTAGHCFTSLIEHPCVTEPVQRLADRGWEISYLPVDPTGIVRWEGASDVFRAAEVPTSLVSVMLVNHETGAIQPVEAIASSLQGRAFFHSDAAAAVGKIPVSFHRLGVDALSVSPHKFHGPKGIGALLLRREVKLRPLLVGGHQEQGRRPGTEPVPLIVGFAKALEIAVHFLERNYTRVLQLRQLLLAQLHAGAEPIVVNSPAAEEWQKSKCIPHIVNVSFPGCRADTLLIALDLAGVACSTGSACSSGSLLPSPVLQAMGLEQRLLTSAMRFSLSPQLNEVDMIEAARRICQTVMRLRQGAAD